MIEMKNRKILSFKDLKICREREKTFFFTFFFITKKNELGSERKRWN